MTAASAATPSGPVADDVLEEVTGRLIDDLKRTKPDGLLLALHGAMVAESFADADGDSMLYVRIATLPTAGTLKYIGSDVVANQDIAATDLANPSQILAEAAVQHATQS